MSTINADRCQCVTCGTCNGRGGHIDPMNIMGDWETCEDCRGSGITELCDYCMVHEEDFYL